MDEQRKPRSREKKVVSTGKGVEKKGEGLGGGPLNNAGSYADRREQEQARQTSRSTWPRTGDSRPAGPSGSGQPGSGTPRQSGFPGSTGSGFTYVRQNARPGGTQNARPGGSQNTWPGGSQSAPRQTGFGRPMNSQKPGSPQPGRKAPAGGGCSGRIFMLAIVLLLLLGGGRITGLFGGGDTSLPTGTSSTGTSSYGTQGSTQSGGSSSSLHGGSAGNGGGAFSSAGSSAGGSGLTDLLSAFLGSSQSSAYDYSGSPLSLQSGSSGYGSDSYAGAGSGYGSGTDFGSGTASGTSSGSAASYGAGRIREKYTQILGGGRDQVTVMVYLCGTDLESQNGMGTADLKEMTKASLGKNVNLLVYTGGCRRWRNNVLSGSVNQIYRIADGKLYCLEKDMGSVSMTKPETLTRFIRYGAENYPANRMCLILWDHGGGSVTGFGYDEKYASGGAMSLAGIDTALKNAGVRFDFIGFDACLMATVENGLMLSDYADYMIASEETEPGVGWYYTNWLSKLGSNPSLPTVEIGRMIADDYVEVCSRQCRGQGTTLSVVDLAELEAAVPAELTRFARSTSELIQQQEYKTVASARSNSREFARSTRIDQIDLVHFAKNLGTAEGRRLAEALQGAVKVNRTGGNMSNAYGLSIYFPYQRTGKVSQMVSTYQAIGMDEEYTRCIQEFASLEMSGQIAAGGYDSQSVGSFLSGYDSHSIGSGSLLSSLLGGGSHGSSSGNAWGGGSNSAGDLTDLLGGLFGGSYGGTSAGDPFSFLSGRSLRADRVAEYLIAHHLDASALVWNGNRITLPKAQWAEVDSLLRNVFVDDGGGFIDLGLDSEFRLEGDALVDDFDGTWLSIDGQPIAYYYLGTEDDGENYTISGYSPALLNGVRVNLMILFDNEHPYGVISGAAPVYTGGETEAQAKNLIAIGAGDRLQFLCEYYSYEGEFKEQYRLGNPLTLGEETEIANTPIGNLPVKVTYCFTDFYRQRYWTPARMYR